MIRVKEALFYLADFLTAATQGASTGIVISPETLRRSKLDDPAVACEMRDFVASLICAGHAIALKPTAGDNEMRSLIALYLSLHLSPFCMAIEGGHYVDIDGSRELLKIACWLLFSNKQLLRHLDETVSRQFFDLDVAGLAREGSPERAQELGRATQSQADAVTELIQLKTIFFMKLDLVRSLQKQRDKSTADLLASLGPLSGTLNSSSQVLSLLANKKAADALSASQKSAKQLTDGVSLRLPALEWMTHAAVEERKQKSQQVSALDHPDAMHTAQRCQDTKLVEFQHVYNQLSKKIDEMGQHAEAIKKFGDFWSDQNQRMAANPDYKRTIGGVVSRETQRLTVKYKQRGGSQTGAPAEGSRQAVDLFKILVDMKKSKKKPQQARVQSQGRGLQQAKEAIECVYGEYEDLVQSVKAYLLSRGIKTIDYGR